MFKKWNPCNPCCGGCTIGFFDYIQGTVVDVFTDATGQLITDPSDINSSLDIIYFGYDYVYDGCDPMSEPSWLTDAPSDMTDALTSYVNGGGKILTMMENTSPLTEPFASAGCLEQPDINIFNKWFQYTDSTIYLKNGFNLDPGCQGNTNLQTAPDSTAEPIFTHMLNGVDQINVGGCGALDSTSSTCYTLLKDKDDTESTIMIEPVGSGYHLAMSDSNMFDSCKVGSVWFDESLDATDGDITKFMDNFCSL